MLKKSCNKFKIDFFKLFFFIFFKFLVEESVPDYVRYTKLILYVIIGNRKLYLKKLYILKCMVEY